MLAHSVYSSHSARVTGRVFRKWLPPGSRALGRRLSYTTNNSQVNLQNEVTETHKFEVVGEDLEISDVPKPSGTDLALEPKTEVQFTATNTVTKDSLYTGAAEKKLPPVDLEPGVEDVAQDGLESSAFLQKPLNNGHQERPTCGASIEAWIGDRHLPPVTLGGIIEVDGQLYGLTVHHMLDDPDFDNEEEKEGSDQNQDSKLVLEHDQELDANQGKTEQWLDSLLSDNPPDAHLPGSPHLNNLVYETNIPVNHGSYSKDNELHSDSDGSSPCTSFGNANPAGPGQFSNTGLEPGDIQGITVGDGEGYIITQPAMDDVPISFFPNVETRDEDHLDSFTFGEIYASSGIKRITVDNVPHEIDWALISINSDRLRSSNFEPHSVASEYLLNPGLDELYLPRKIVPWNELGGLEVFGVGRTSGYQTGVILPTMERVKVYGRTTPSSSYVVIGGQFVPGDTGTWLIDRHTGNLCGYVLAYSERKKASYLVPMDIAFKDIQETLNAKIVRLPHSSTENTPIESPQDPKYVDMNHDRVNLVKMKETEKVREDSLVSTMKIVDFTRPTQTESVAPALDLTSVSRSIMSRYLEKMMYYYKALATNPPKTGNIRLKYTCTCGKAIQADFPENQELAATEIALNLSKTRSATTGVEIQTAQGDTSTFELSSSITQQGISNSAHPDAQETQPNSEAETKAETTSGSQRTPSMQPSSVLPRFLLLCVDTTRIAKTGKYRVTMSNIDISATTIWNDQLLFNKIRETYYSQRPKNLLSLRTPKSLYFIELELVPIQNGQHSVAILENPSLPPAEEVHLKQEYHYTPCPTKGVHVPDNIFFHAFFEPGIHLEDWCLNRLPKKLNSRFEGRSKSGWGIYIVEGPDWYVISVLIGLLFSATGFVGVLWSVLRSDVQGGFGIASYLATLCTAALSVLFFR